LLQGTYQYHKGINDDCVLATGKQSKTLEHGDSAAQDAELSYIIHMQPDKYEEALRAR